MTKYISVTETAKMMRVDLKAAFPGQKFSVRGSKYAGGASIDVSWTDGPTEEVVNKVIKVYAGATFDGMTDMKSYVHAERDGEEVSYGADFVFAGRNFSKSFMAAVCHQVKMIGCEHIQCDTCMYYIGGDGWRIEWPETPPDTWRGGRGASYGCSPLHAAQNACRYFAEADLDADLLYQLRLEE